MIVYEGYGDLFRTPCQTAIVTVNCIGAMGRGIALGAKLLYPDIMQNYRKHCFNGNLVPGKLMFYHLSRGNRLLLFPTKKDWRDNSEIEYIEAGLEKLVETYADKGITSLALSLLGCTNGKLKEKDVKPLIYGYLDPLDIPVHLYIGRGAPVQELYPKK